jgi:phytol kinase
MFPGTVFLLYAALAASLAGRLRCAGGVRAPYTRKVFHFLIISASVPVQLRWGLEGVMLFGWIVSGCVLLAVLRGAGFSFYEAMARPSDAPHQTLFILVPLCTTALGGALANVFFPTYAQVGYLVCGWGDAVGEPVGTRWGRHRYRVPSLAGVPVERSWEGSLAVFSAGTAAAAIALAAGGEPWSAAVAVGAACGSVCALVEAVSHHGLDNLTVQLAAAGVATVLLL